jgi:hypothetical protein
MQSGQKFDLVYLDSWDVDWLDPIPSAIHGLNEFLVVLPMLVQNGALLLVDDTPSSPSIFRSVTGLDESIFTAHFEKYGLCPGKGSLVLDYLAKRNLGKLIAHDYQVLWQF